MSKLHFKGGAWTNAEDQVLQTALAQYGLRDWERVASMLTKKTADQCRERWENFLDPRLNIKEAWSIEEETKLVELQSLFPNKWRLIANELAKSTPTHYIRPPWLCEQRHLELHDAFTYEQQRKQQDGGSSTAQTLDEFMEERKRRRAAYQAHEEKAARSDTVDGERFEKEMLSMAVSRMANQDQKKGLRKERQRQLEEASFLAKLESNRESIESGTLSARQEKRMRKALEEDRRPRQRIEGGGDADDDDDDDDDEEDGDGGSFQPVDMLEDQAKAGIHKKSRTLLLDLEKQQQSALQASSAADGRPLGSSSTGVNHELLMQAVAAPQLSAGPAKPALTASAGTTWDALAGPATDAPDLDDIFAALPEVVTTTTTSTSQHAQSKPPVAAAAVSSSTPSVAPVSVVGAHTLHASQSTLQGPIRVTAVMPPPLAPSVVDTQRGRGGVTVAAGYAYSLQDVDAQNPAWKQRLDAAAQRVAVEAERLLLAQRRREQQQQKQAVASSTTSAAEDNEDAEDRVGDDKDEWRGASLAAAKAMVAAAAASMGIDDDDDDSIDVIHRAQAEMQLWTCVNCESAVAQLEEEAREDVEAVEARVAAARAWVEKMCAICFVDSASSDPLLHGYISNSGTIKRAAELGATSTATLLAARQQQRTGSSSSASSFSTAAYAQQYWATQLAHRQQHLTFLNALRSAEHIEMRRQLDAANHKREELVVEERRLQEEFRERNIQKR